MKKRLLLAAVLAATTTNASANAVALVIHAPKIYKAVKLLTAANNAKVVVASAATAAVVVKTTTATLTVLPQAESLVTSRTRMTTQEARECINKVAFGPEYQKFNKWTDDVNRGTHACIHGAADTMHYCVYTRKMYDRIAFKASNKNRWKLPPRGDRFVINRGAWELILTSAGKIVSAFRKAPPPTYKYGGSVTKKYRKRLFGK